MKIVSIVGARPQFIKAAIVSRVLGGIPDVREVLIHTGQHYDDNMSDVFFDELEIPNADYNLGVGSGPHGRQTGKMLEGIEKALIKEKPDWVLVYGDTNSTLAGTLAAAKLQIPIAHIEAGLRSFNKGMPEEVNRIIADHASSILFAPTKLAVENLRKEGIDKKKIFLVGDVMYDAAVHYGKKAETNSYILDRLNLSPRNYILFTLHRAENTNSPKRLKAIMRGLKAAAESMPVILPLHPRTRYYTKAQKISFGKIKVIAPVGYLDMIKLEKNAQLIATDSGGVQKEAFFYNVPCITLRSETEWAELVELGWNRILKQRDWNNINKIILSSLHIRGEKAYPYGFGNAAQKIAKYLISESNK